MFKGSFIFIFNIWLLENYLLKKCYLNGARYIPGTLLILSEDFSVHISRKSEILKPFLLWYSTLIELMSSTYICPPSLL